jgi:hypothetical protein
MLDWTRISLLIGFYFTRTCELEEECNSVETDVFAWLTLVSWFCAMKFFRALESFRIFIEALIRVSRRSVTFLLVMGHMLLAFTFTFYAYNKFSEPGESEQDYEYWVKAQYRTMFGDFETDNLTGN